MINAALEILDVIRAT